MGVFFFTACEIPNNPVNISSLTANSSFTWIENEVRIICVAEDSDDDKLSYNWIAASGVLNVNNDTAIWIAPDSIGYYHIICKVSDGVGSSDAEKVTIRVVEDGLVINGIITDAVTNLPLQTVEISMGSNNTISQDDGSYSFFIPGVNGLYQINASNEMYCPFSGNIFVPDDYLGDEFIYNFSMSPIPELGEIRFVLNWGSEPRDLDSHLKTPLIDGQEYHISYANRGNVSSAPFAILDVDDVDGYGPETITIKQSYIGTYLYYIYNYSNGSMVESNATVRIYNSPDCDGEIINIPDEGDGRYWNVCSINGENGNVTIVNQIVENEPEI